MSRLEYARMKLQKRVFNIRCRNVLKTPPVECAADSNVVILTQLYHPDVIMSLLAVKSLARFIQINRFVVVDDGLTDKDQDRLRHHFSRVDFISTSDVRKRQRVIPSGGTWERLMSIAELNDQNYVIQLDADTLTINRPDEIIDAISQQSCFTLGTPSGRKIVSATEAAKYASNFQSAHVQAKTEEILDKTRVFDDPKYVRGCSGFAGFSPGTLSSPKIEQFSSEVSALIGAEKWAEWGSEQVTSNFFVANAAGARVLPVETYPFWAPDVSWEQSRLIHFFGTYRFHGGAYARLGRQLIQELS